MHLNFTDLLIFTAAQQTTSSEIQLAKDGIMYYVHQTLLSHVRLPYRRSGNETSSEVTETKFLTSELKP